MKIETKINHINRILKLHDRARKQYEKADRIFSRLAAAVPVGEIIDTGESGQFTIVDNFANVNAAFRVARISRLELKPVGRGRKKAPIPKPGALAADPVLFPDRETMNGSETTLNIGSPSRIAAAAAVHGNLEKEAA